jgi:hypothetical protein
MRDAIAAYVKRVREFADHVKVSDIAQRYRITRIAWTSPMQGLGPAVGGVRHRRRRRRSVRGITGPMGIGVRTAYNLRLRRAFRSLLCREALMQ